MIVIIELDELPHLYEHYYREEYGDVPLTPFIENKIKEMFSKDVLENLIKEHFYAYHLLDLIEELDSELRKLGIDVFDVIGVNIPTKKTIFLETTRDANVRRSRPTKTKTV